MATAYSTQNDIALRERAKPSETNCVGKYLSVVRGVLRDDLISSRL